MTKILLCKLLGDGVRLKGRKYLNDHSIKLCSCCRLDVNNIPGFERKLASEQHTIRVAKVNCENGRCGIRVRAIETEYHHSRILCAGLIQSRGLRQSLNQRHVILLQDDRTLFDDLAKHENLIG